MGLFCTGLSTHIPYFTLPWDYLTASLWLGPDWCCFGVPVLTCSTLLPYLINKRLTNSAIKFIVCTRRHSYAIHLCLCQIQFHAFTRYSSCFVLSALPSQYKVVFCLHRMLLFIISSFVLTEAWHEGGQYTNHTVSISGCFCCHMFFFLKYKSKRS